MKCPKCGYLGFENGDRCRNCGYDFSCAGEPGSTSELSMRNDRAALGPLADFPLSDPDELRPKPAAGRATDSGLDLERLPGAPSQSRGALSLFPAEHPDDLPLITPPPVPRPPLAVRRAAPDLSRPRPVAPRAVELALELEPPRPPDRADPARAVIGTTGEAIHEAAGLARRVIAGLTDLAILLSIDLLTVYFTLRLCGLELREIGMLPIAPLLVFFVLVNGGYLIAFTAAGGQTIGKMTAGIRVVSDDREPVDVARATVRTVTCAVSALPAGLGFLAAFVGPERRALHDRFAKTRVVKVSS